MATTYKTKLTEQILRTPETMSFRFERPDSYDYRAGQWFVITLPGPGEPLVHHFTHSSSPTEPFLEFTTRLTGSPFKRAMEALEPGAEAELEAPFGSFVLKDDVEKGMFLTGGIGITPVRSILRDLADRGRDRRLSVLYANEREETVTFGDELVALADALPSVRLVQVLSDPPEGWQGWRGRIRPEILEQEVEDPASWHYYLCGPPGMVQAMRDMLCEFEIARGQMTLENFEGYE